MRISRIVAVLLIAVFITLTALLLGCGGSGASSLPIKVNLSMYVPLTLGRSETVFAYFYLETGSPDKHDITVRMILPDGLEKISGDLEWKGDIIGGESYTFSAEVVARKPGTFEIVARADSSKRDGMIGYTNLVISVPDKIFTLPGNLSPPLWVNVSYYYDANQTINVKVGEEFTIGLDTHPRLGWYWEMHHDENMISLVDYKGLAYPLAYDPCSDWFLFKALQAGKTQITFTHYYPSGAPFDQKVFNVEIE